MKTVYYQPYSLKMAFSMLEMVTHGNSILNQSGNTNFHDGFTLQEYLFGSEDGHSEDLVMHANFELLLR